MKKDSVKIVTIGGGSSYTPELVEGFIKRYDTLPVRELWLVDIEAGREKLETVGALAKRMVAKAGVPMKIILSYDRREALKDADFVTTQMRIGRLPARILDERTYHQVCPHLRRLRELHKLSIAIIHHTEHIRLSFLNKCNQFSDSLHRQRRS